MSDQDLRRLLHEAVDDVRPAHGPEEIRARARRGPARPPARRWAPLVVAAAAAVVLVIGGAAWLSNQVAGQRTPSPSADGGTSPTLTQRTADVAVYYVGEPAGRPVLFRERHRVGTTGTDLDAAVREALARPPADGDYAAFPAGAAASALTAQATQGPDAITVDIAHWQPPGPADLGSADAQRMALQAVVWTADTATGTVLPVRFLVDGQPVATLLSTDTSVPVEPLPGDSALSPVSITSPTEGATVPGTFTVTGQASAAEANVIWELTQGGRVVRQGFATAQECCTLSPYSFTVSAPPGSYTLVVHNTNESNGEGVAVTRDTKTIHVG